MPGRWQDDAPAFHVHVPPAQPVISPLPRAGQGNDADGVDHGRAQATLGFHGCKRREQARVVGRVEYRLALAVAAEVDAVVGL